MKKIAISLIFFLSLAAYAVDWRLVGDAKESKLYLDMDSFRDVNGYRRGWLMTSYSKRQLVNEAGYKSDLALKEVDCKEGRSRNLSGMFRSEEMGRGDVIGSFEKPDTAKWSFIVPGSVGEFEARVFCNHSMK